METYKVIPSHPLPADENLPANSAPADAVPKEKKLIRCELCGRTVNSESQAQAHFKGLYHLSQMQAHGMTLPPETDHEKLKQYNAKAVKAMNVTSGRAHVGGPNFYNRRGVPPFDARMPGMGMPVTGMPATGMPASGMPPPPPPPMNSYMNPTYNTPVTAPGKRVMCEICGVTANSPTQAQSHLNGRKHLTKLAELGLPVPKGVSAEFLEATSVSMRQNRKNFEGPKMPMQERFAHRVPQFPTPRFQYSQQHGPRMFSFRPPNPMMNAPFHNGPAAPPRGSTYQMRVRTLIPCEICQLLFNSQGQAQAHFSGSKHQKKVRMVNYYQRNVEKAQSPTAAALATRQIVCPVCSTTVNSDKQMDAHVQGKLHKSKLEQKPTSDEKQEERVVQEDPELEAEETEERVADKSNSVYDLANCVPGSPLNPPIYHQQQHYTGPESDESAAAAAAAAKQSI